MLHFDERYLDIDEVTFPQVLHDLLGKPKMQGPDSLLRLLALKDEVMSPFRTKEQACLLLALKQWVFKLSVPLL